MFAWHVKAKNGFIATKENNVGISYVEDSSAGLAWCC